MPAAATDALVAAVILITASSIRGDLLFLIALPLTLAGTLFAVRSLLRPFRPAEEHWIARVAPWLSVMAVVGVTTSSLHGPTWWEAARRGYAIAGLIAVGVLTDGGDKARSATMAFLIAWATLLHMTAPWVLPAPSIDVWQWTQACVRALLHGVNPYTVQVPDPTRHAFDYGYALRIYPYLPASLLAYAPVVALVGDYRFLLALCVPVTIALVRVLGRRLNAPALFVDAVTLGLLLHPRGPSFSVMGWTEPLLVAVAAAFTYAAVRAPDGALQATLFFLLPALKQYFAAPVLLYFLMKPPRPRVRSIAIGLGVAAATFVPFVWWNWRAAFEAIVFQMRELRTPRLDSDSIVALVAVTTGHVIGRWWAVAAQFGAVVFSYVYARQMGLSGMLVGSALSLEMGFLLGWQAFFNYYYLIGALLLFAALTMSTHSDDPLCTASSVP